MNQKIALVVGNTDGIGAKATRDLIERGYRVTGISKRRSPIEHANYSHIVQDVSLGEYRERLNEVLTSLPHVDLCIYSAGIGENLDWNDLAFETKVFEVNLRSAVITAEIVLTAMVKQGHGHFIGLSSVADILISPDSPSYCASKSGISNYLESLGCATKLKNIKISNIRFGFVDTKMAKSEKKPFLLSVEEASAFILDVIERPRIRATKPKIMIPLVWLLSLGNRMKLLINDLLG